MRLENYNARRDQLLNQCYDYKLPVSRADSIETLENYLEAVKDEAIILKNKGDNEYFFLEKDPVYIGKYESALKTLFIKMLPI